MTPAAMALAAVCGCDRVDVRSEPEVALVMFGAEIVAHGVPQPGQVRDAFGDQLPPLLRHHGAKVTSVLRVGDNLTDTITALSSVGPRLIISTGGSARGATDHVRSALTALDAELLVDGVDMRPGHPVILAARPDETLLLCLPGNPLAAMTALITLGLPLLDGMLGRYTVTDGVVVADECIGNPALSGVRIVPYTLSHGRAVPAPFQGSGMLRGLVSASGLAVIPAGGALAGESLVRVALPW